MAGTTFERDITLIQVELTDYHHRWLLNSVQYGGPSLHSLPVFHAFYAMITHCLGIFYLNFDSLFDRNISVLLDRYILWYFAENGTFSVQDLMEEDVTRNSQFTVFYI